MAHRLQTIGLGTGNPLRGFGLGGFGLCLIALVGLFSLAAGTPISIVLPIAGACLIVGVVLIVWSALQGRTYANDIRNMGAGSAWVNWHYDAATWQSFATADRMRAAREIWQLLGGGIAIGVVVGVVLAALGGGWLTIGVAVGVFAVAAIIAAISTALSAQRRDAAIGPAGGELYISGTGIYQPPGRYTPLQGFNLRPIAGKVEAGSPAELVLTTQVQGRYGPRRNDVRVPIPPGQEASADQLLERFRDTYGWSS